MVEGTSLLVLVLKLEDHRLEPEAELAWLAVAEIQVPPQAAGKVDNLHKVTTVLGKEGAQGTAVETTAGLEAAGAGPVGFEVVQKLEAVLQKL